MLSGILTCLSIVFCSISLILLCYNLGRLYAIYEDLKDEVQSIKKGN